MNKNRIGKKALCVISLAAVLGIGSTLSVYAFNQKDSLNAIKTAEENDDKVLELNHTQSDKEETVYVITQKDGSTQKIIVSEWLKNPDKKAVLTDSTNLKNLVNVKGNETFTQNGSTVTWNAGGNDIYYQGTVEKQLPVDIKITYTLDGKAVKADEIRGKSGKLVIRLDYTNNAKSTATVNGKQENMYVPFFVVSAAILNNDSFRNVTVTNGKLINDGDKSVIAGMALPGMQENLGIGKDVIDLPDSIEITADVTDFEAPTFLSVATNEIFNKVEMGNISSVDELKEKLSQLSEASKQLVQGSDALYQGIAVLQSKTGALTDGIDRLYDGSGELKAGAYTLANGAKELKAGAGALANGAQELTGGISELNQGLAYIESNGAGLVGGAKQVFDTLLATANAQISAAGITVPTLTTDNYATVITSVINNISGDSMEAQAARASLQNILTQLNTYNEFYQGIIAYTNGVANVKAGSDRLTVGANELTAGAQSLYSGMNELNAGAGALSSGADNLNSGMASLKDNTALLVDGINQLLSGSKELNEGMTKFNDEGIEKLINALNSVDAGSLIDRISALSELSRSYQSFGGKDDTRTGSVKFIFRS